MTLLAFYVVVITLGILSMGFQLLASRLLNPHFGSSISVWAWLISTFLAAFSAGSMIGGWLSNLAPAPRRRGQLAGAVLNDLFAHPPDLPEPVAAFMTATASWMV